MASKKQPQIQHPYCQVLYSYVYTGFELCISPIQPQPDQHCILYIDSLDFILRSQCSGDWISTKYSCPTIGFLCWHKAMDWMVVGMSWEYLRIDSWNEVYNTNGRNRWITNKRIIYMVYGNLILPELPSQCYWSGPGTLGSLGNKKEI